MKVLFINELFGTKRQGGQEIASSNLVAGLRKNGIEIEERTLSGQEKTTKVKVPWPRILLETPYLREMKGFPLVGRYFLRNLNGASLIHATSPSLFTFAKPNQPLVLTVHGIKSEKAIRLRSMKFAYKLLFNPVTIWWLKLTERRGLKKASAVIVLTERTRSYIINNLGIENSKIKLIPNGVHTNRFTYQLGTETSAIFVGRATIPKGIEPLLAAVEKYSLKLTIVTSRISKEYLAKAKRLGVRVYLSIPNSELANIYHKSSVFVLPSYDEEQPLTVLEAMACGLPIVTTAIGSGGVVEHNKNGFIIKPTVDEIGSTLTALLKDKNRLQKFGLSSRALAEKHSWSNVVKQYRRVYDSLSPNGSERTR